MARARKSMDGNTAASHVSYCYSDNAIIYPITPSSPMPELVDKWAANGRKNAFGNQVTVTEMQSEAGASGAVHGALQGGALTTTYTASQGLLLMIPNLYKMVGERLPGVIHVAARSISTSTINMYGDHQDVMACRQIGLGMLAEGSVQEIMDLAPVAHLSAIEARIPFLNFFDGFRTSHEIQKIEVWDYEDLADMLEMAYVDDFKNRSLNPERPVERGVFEKAGYFQRQEAQNQAYDRLPAIVEKYMNKVNAKLGTHYAPFTYYGDPEAEIVAVLMGSGTDTMEETVRALNAQGRKVGVIKVHLYRPFSARHFLSQLPDSTRKLVVLDRTKERGSVAEPLYLDVQQVIAEAEKDIRVYGGRFGLGQKDTTPAMFKAVFDNVDQEKPKNHFTIGIHDDVTHTSLDFDPSFVVRDKSMMRCKFWGVGGDGTVGANKNAIKIIGDNTDKFVQGYFDYDAKKSNGLTESHLRFSDSPIHSAYLLDEADFVSCSPQSYVFTYDLVKELKKGGTFLLNTIWSDAELEDHLPGQLKREIYEKKIDFYTINASKVAQEVGLGQRVNMVVQTAFFALSKVLPIEESIDYLKKSIVSSYGHKGEDVVAMNFKAVDRALEELHKVDVPEAWAQAKDRVVDYGDEPDFIKNMVRPIINLKEDDLPVSTYLPYDDGTYMAGTSRYEKRGISLFVPHWHPENCIQCNSCSYVCPHATIRPFLLTEEEKAKAPEGFETIAANGKAFQGYSYRIQVDTYDCLGCGNCADICPAKEKALTMELAEDERVEQKDNWLFADEVVGYKEDLVEATNPKNSQFFRPYLEFNGACAGCGESPYARLITQLYGDHMLVANATGCSSIWGSSVPSMPYCTDSFGRGPAWANSLFEDAAEYGYGMALAQKSNRALLTNYMKDFIALDQDATLNRLFKDWMEVDKDYRRSRELSDQIIHLAKEGSTHAEGQALLERILALKDYLAEKSVWIYGGDGWSYDIGFGGVDHVLASGEDINVMVFDTEVYSNTGGQSSKATPLAAVAKFAASGKKVRKKDLGLMMTSYGYVYVAQIAMGANNAQTLKAIREAEAYHGPSLIIAYAPCINHGLKCGMGKTQEREKLAVEAGYWHMWRFNPSLAKEGKNPFIMDSKAPTGDFQEFLQGEVRYASLKREFPETADELYAAAEQAAKDRYQSYLDKLHQYEATAEV